MGLQAHGAALGGDVGWKHLVLGDADPSHHSAVCSCCCWGVGGVLSWLGVFLFGKVPPNCPQNAFLPPHNALIGADLWLPAH